MEQLGKRFFRNQDVNDRSNYCSRLLSMVILTHRHSSLLLLDFYIERALSPNVNRRESHPLRTLGALSLTKQSRRHTDFEIPFITMFNFFNLFRAHKPTGRSYPLAVDPPRTQFALRSVAFILLLLLLIAGRF